MKSRTAIQMAILPIVAVMCLATVDSSYPQQSPTRPGPGGANLGRSQTGGPQVGRPQVGRLGGAGASRSTSRGAGSSRGGVGDVSVVTGRRSGAPPRLSGDRKPFEPIYYRDVHYGDVPETQEDISISLVGPMSTVEFLDALSLATGWNIVVSAAVQALQLQFWTQDVTPKQAMAILEFNDIYYKYDEETEFLFVTTVEEHIESEYGAMIELEFTIRHADLSALETVVNSLLSPSGRLVSDPTLSKMLVMDTRDNVDHIKRAIEKLDKLVVAEVFSLTHLDADALRETIGALMTEAGRMDVDSRTNTLIVTDRPERVERIAEIIYQLDHELETRSWLLDYADPIEIADMLAALVPESMGSIIVNETIHQITVTATPQRLDEVGLRIMGWDQKRRQVQIEAYLVTAESNVLRDIGISWSYATTIKGDPIAAEVGSAVPVPDPETGLADFGALVGSQRLSFLTDNFAAVLDTLDSSADATILAHPRITVQDGEQAHFENTTQVPFASSTTTFGNNNVGNNFNSNTRIEFIDVGTILEVTPRIASDQNILLDISAEDSSFVSVIVIANGSPNTLPQKTQNKAETQVLVRSGETIVLGGLRTTNFRETEDRVPFLGGLPIIGRAFRSTSKDHQDRELLIFLTPTIVDTMTQPEAMKLAKFDDEIAEIMRSDAKTTLGRILDKMNMGKRDIPISIGQSGGLLAEGDAVSLSELRTLLMELKHPHSKKIILRTHPSAPADLSMEITEIAMDRGIKIKFDNVRVPIVPRPQESVESAEAAGN